MSTNQMTRRRVGRSLLVTGVAAALCAAGLPSISSADPPAEVYKDLSYSFKERAADLVSRLTTAEKINQLRQNTPAALGGELPSYNYSNEALHGVTSPAGSTMLPSGTAIASTWNRGLANFVGSVISDEARAQNNATGKGLTYWSPTLNLDRDPRWGRADESYGEDPYLTGQIGAEFVLGMQGDDPTYLKTVSTPKHYYANNSESNRRHGDSVVTEKETREYYTPAFAHVLSPEIGAASFMTAYNRIAGVPASANFHALQTLARRTWGFDSYVTSDCSAILDVYVRHKWVPDGASVAVTPQEGVAWTLKAGTTLDCQGYSYRDHLPGAFANGLATSADIDSQLTELLTARFQLGHFDPASSVRYRGSEYSVAAQWASAPHQAASKNVAEEAPVLLKNNYVMSNIGPTPSPVQTSQRGLPLTAADAQDLVVLGYTANEFTAGGYSGSNPVDNRSIRTGIEQVAKEINPGGTVSYFDGITPSASGSGKPGVTHFKTRNATATTTDLSFHDYSHGYAVSTNPNPPAPALLFWEGWMGINWDNANYMQPSPVWGGYFAAKIDVPVGTTELGLTQWATAAQVAPGSVFEVHDGSMTGTVVATVTASTGNTAATNGSDYWGAYNGTPGEHTFYVVWNPGTLGTYGQAGQLGHEFAFSLAPADEDKIRDASAVVVVVGTRANESAEETDRVNLDFPRFQEQLVTKAASLNPNTVVWIQSVGQMNIESFRSLANVPSIVWSNYNGQHQGITAAETLFGKVNPSGKLPMTWYSTLNDLGSVWDYALAPDGSGSKGRTYQYFTGAVSYPFGYGLSYSRFQYSNLRLDKSSLTGDESFTATVDVTNSSTVPGKEAVELYVTAPGANGIDRPKKQLRGFEKVSLGALETRTVSITVDAKDLWFWDEAANKAVWDQGKWTVLVGSSSATGLTTNFTLTAAPAPALSVVATIPDGTVLNTQAPNNRIHANLSATDVDQSFLDLSAADVQVAFSSGDPAVARVDVAGSVAPVGAGVTTITAAVTYQGVTKTSSFPVVVQDDTASAPVIDFSDQIVQAAQTTAGVQLTATPKLLPAGVTVTSTTYLLAPADVNTAGATVTAGGLLTTSGTGLVKVNVLVALSDGTTADQSALIKVVDPQPVPQARINVAAPANGTAYDSAVTFNLEATVGNATEFALFEVNIDNQGWVPVAGPVTVSGDGSHTVQARVTDALGQPSPTVSATINIRTAALNVSVVTAVGDNGQLTLTASGADVARLEYSPNGVNWKTYTIPVQISGVVYYRVVDIAGNVSATDFISVPAAAADPILVPGETQIVQVPTVVPGQTQIVEVPTLVPGETRIVEVPASTSVNPNTPNTVVLKTMKGAKPTISGKAVAGQKLKAKVAKSKWTKGVKFSYQWYANGKKIAKATKATFKVKAKYVGKRIKVKVTGKLAGYKNLAKVSKIKKIKAKK